MVLTETIIDFVMINEYVETWELVDNLLRSVRRRDFHCLTMRLEFWRNLFNRQERSLCLKWALSRDHGALSTVEMLTIEWVLLLYSLSTSVKQWISFHAPSGQRRLLGFCIWRFRRLYSSHTPSITPHIGELYLSFLLRQKVIRKIQTWIHNFFSPVHDLFPKVECL